MCVRAVGGIIGFSLVWDGADAIKWAEKDPNSFPPYKGVIAIILAWFVSPLLTGGVAAFIFWAVRSIVLRRENAYELAFYTLPPFVLLTTWVNIYFVLTKVRSLDPRQKLTLNLPSDCRASILYLDFAPAM